MEFSDRAGIRRRFRHVCGVEGIRESVQEKEWIRWTSMTREQLRTRLGRISVPKKLRAFFIMAVLTSQTGLVAQCRRRADRLNIDIPNATVITGEPAPQRTRPVPRPRRRLPADEITSTAQPDPQRDLGMFGDPVDAPRRKRRPKKEPIKKKPTIRMIRT